MAFVLKMCWVYKNNDAQITKYNSTGDVTSNFI